MQSIIDAIGPRLREPSTWAGLLTFVGTMLGYQLPVAYASPVTTVLAGLAGLALVYVRERERRAP